MNILQSYRRAIIVILLIMIYLIGNCRLNFYVIPEKPSFKLIPWVKIRKEIVRLNGWEWFIEHFVKHDIKIYLCLADDYRYKSDAMYMSCNANEPEIAVEIYRCINILSSRNDTIHICVPNDNIQDKINKDPGDYSKEYDGYMENSFWSIVNHLFRKGNCVYNIGSNLTPESKYLVLLDETKCGRLILDESISELYRNACRRSQSNPIQSYNDYCNADDTEKKRLLQFMELSDSLILRQGTQQNSYPLDFDYQESKQDSPQQIKMHILISGCLLDLYKTE